MTSQVKVEIPIEIFSKLCMILMVKGRLLCNLLNIWKLYKAAHASDD